MSASSISASPAGVSLTRPLSPLPSLEHEEHGLGSDSLAPLSHLESHGGVELTISLSYSPKVPVGRLGSDGSLDDTVGPSLSLSPAVASVSVGHGPDNFSLTRTYASPPFSAMAAASAVNSLAAPLPQDPSEWTVAHVLQYISSLGLGHLKDKFEQNGVDGEQLLDLTYSDLQEDLEVEAEDEINKLLAAIAGLQKFVKRDENGNRLTGTGETPTITPRHASTASHDDDAKAGLDNFHAPYPMTLSSPTLLGVPGPEESLLDHHHSASALSSSIGHSSMASMTVGLAATTTRAMSLSDAALTVPPDTYSSAVSSTYSHAHSANGGYYAPCTLCVCSCSSCVSTSTMGHAYGYTTSAYPTTSAVGHHADHSVSLSITDTKRKRDPSETVVGIPALSRKKSRQFSWFASVESCVMEHERYCDNYIRGSTQHGVEPGICCRDLVSHSSYVMHLVPDSNDCCGVSDSITLTNSVTGGVIGTLPCSMTAIFAPLLRHHYIVLSGRIDNLVHPSVGVPPFELRIEVDVPGLMAVKKDPRWSGLIQRLRSFLTGWNSDWIPPSYPPNVEELKDMLS